MSKKIVLLCSECFSTTVLYNYINRQFPIAGIITEEPMRGLALAKRRIKKLGILHVSGQVAFSALIVPVLRLLSRKRIAEIKKQYLFDETILPAATITRFQSVNDDACIDYLKKLKPDLVLVNGTRIISTRMLQAVPAPFINMHAGITPFYRGVHGAYWAIVQDDLKNCGVTIHLVDKGVDTGGILYQSTIEVSSRDNFITYPYIQYGVGLPLVKQAISDADQDSLHPLQQEAVKGKLWYHPTIWQYLYLKLAKGKK